MAERGSYGLGPRLDIKQLQIEAQNRWLRPAEVREILCNYQKFHIASEPPKRPPSGSLFLFDRKVLRYFRKDGHNWRKKKDGKTVKEAHEKLKVGSVDVLHCYYAHGEENENFQRRSYWMLEENLTHIVFVHYLQVKGNRTYTRSAKETDEVSSTSSIGGPSSSSSPTSHTRATFGNVDPPSPSSTMTSLYEDVDSEDHQATSKIDSSPGSLQTGNGPLMDKLDGNTSGFYIPQPYSDYLSEIQTDAYSDNNGGINMIDSQKTLGSASWEEIFKQSMTDIPSHDSTLGQQNMIPGKLMGNTAVKEYGLPWQIPLEDFPEGSGDQLSDLESLYEISNRLSEQGNHDDIYGSKLSISNTHPDMQNHQPLPNDLHIQLTNDESQFPMKWSSENDIPVKGNLPYPLAFKQSLLDGEEGLKKVDSFSRWVSKELKELGEVDDLRMESSSGISWTTVDCGDIVGDSSLSPSLSQDQLFSISSFSPKWTYMDSEAEVLIIGRYLGAQQIVAINWSCMFGEVEVPAEVLADGILCCRAPPHSVGQVPFYITCSNRVACSEVREFEYLAGPTKDIDVKDIYNGASYEMLLHMQLVRLLSSTFVNASRNLFEGALEKHNLIIKLIALNEEEDCYREEANIQKDSMQNEWKKSLFEKAIKEKLYSWLFRKITEDSKGPNMLDDKGQGVLHLAAALGYDWALKPIVTAGVSINFRDDNGWTALHWAAFCGREQTIAVLISLGAATGVLTDPSPDHPLGRTPADLASSNGHKGISGFLAESSLTSYLESLKMTDTKEDSTLEASTPKPVQTVSDRMPTPIVGGYNPYELSLKDSLTAICNATQAAGRIYQMFRIQSFQRKQLTEKNGDDEFEKQASLGISARVRKPGQGYGHVQAAAVHIQKKFRGWKKRKEFLIIRQRIVKIQAHIRGHQVRKQYRTIIWSVGILEKIILRWRRKGSGLRGFKPDGISKEPNPETKRDALTKDKEDDYDFLKEGRRQTEERLQKALTRVKSMAQYPEGRDQYRRLLTVVQGFRETKVSGMAITSLDQEIPYGNDDEDLIDYDTLLDDDTLMSITFDLKE